MTGKVMTKYAFRGECLQDVFTFVAAVADYARIIGLQVEQDPIFPDCDAWVVVDLSLKKLQEIACNIEDGHIIAESITLEGVEEIRL